MGGTSLPDSACGSALLCWVAVFLLGTKDMEAAVTQSPRNKVTVTGGNVTLSCHQTNNHNNMYWYRQDMGHGLRLIHYSYGAGSTEKGDVPDGYKATRLIQQNFSLMLELASPSQTAVYLCASSDAQRCMAACPLHIKKEKHPFIEVHGDSFDHLTTITSQHVASPTTSIDFLSN